jgi:protein-disulfide isomerase
MSHQLLIPAVGPDDHAQGSPDALVTVVAYGDYECPLSGCAHVVLDFVRQELGEYLRLVFRNFPLTDPHPHARRAAEAAESVAARGGEDAFWAMHDILYENQDALEDDDLLGYAEAVGADPRMVADDLASGAMLHRVRHDVQSGVRSGVDGTPAFFVNGRRFDGLWSDPVVFAEELRAAAHASADG